jgi:hypothetical protein
MAKANEKAATTATAEATTDEGGVIATTAKPTGPMTVGELAKMFAKGRTKTPPSAQAAETDENAERGTRNAEEETAALSEQATAEGESPEDGQTAEAEPGDEKTGADGDAKQPKAINKLLKRVHSLVDQRDMERNGRLEAERQLAELKGNAERGTRNAEPQQQDQPAWSPKTLDDALAWTDQKVRDLDRMLADVDEFEDWAEANTDGGSFKEGEKTYELSADEIRTFLRKGQNQRTRLLSQREARMEMIRQQHQEARATAHEEAVRLYPWLEKKDSAEFQEALQIVRGNPAVLHRADFELMVARQVAGGRLEREAAKKLPKKPAGSPAPVVTHAPAAAAKANPGDTPTTLKAAEEGFGKTGRVGDLGKLLAERRKARLAAA